MYYDNDYDFDPMRFEDDEFDDNDDIDEVPFTCPFFRGCPFTYRMGYITDDPRLPNGPGQMPGQMPGQGPGQMPGQMPSQGPGQGQGQMPPGPPPTYTPNKNMQLQGGNPSLKAVDSGAIRFCRYKYTYIWETNGRSYWAYITFVGRRSISGYRWTGRRWVYFGLDLRRIESFVCR